MSSGMASLGCMAPSGRRPPATMYNASATYRLRVMWAIVSATLLRLWTVTRRRGSHSSERATWIRPPIKAPTPAAHRASAPLPSRPRVKKAMMAKTCAALISPAVSSTPRLRVNAMRMTN